MGKAASIEFPGPQIPMGPENSIDRTDRPGSGLACKIFAVLNTDGIDWQVCRRHVQDISARSSARNHLRFFHLAKEQS